MSSRKSRTPQQSKRARAINHHEPHSVPGGKCSTGKRRFHTEVDAKIALDRAKINSLRNPKRKECRYYVCPQCDGFHLSSMPLAKGIDT